MENAFSTKIRAGKRRTYFFDVKQTKGDDYFVTITESTRRYEGDGYERHKIFLYKEDFNRFLQGLNEAVNHVKTELLPDYDYEQYERRQEEWEKENVDYDKSSPSPTSSPSSPSEPKLDTDEEISW